MGKLRYVLPIMLMVLIIVGLSQPASAANLLQNPGFETGSLDPFWHQEHGGIAGGTLPLHSGSYSGAVEVGDGMSGYLEQHIPAPYSCAKYLEFWYWTAFGTATVTDFGIDVFSSDGGKIWQPLASSEGHWTKAHVDIDTARLVTMIDVYLEISDGVGAFFVDDFYLQDCSYEPPGNPNVHVGGNVFTANKAVIVAPYLMALISVVAVAAVVVKRRRT